MPRSNTQLHGMNLWVEATGQHFPTLISKGMAVKFIYGTPGSTERPKNRGEGSVTEQSCSLCHFQGLTEKICASRQIGRQVDNKPGTQHHHSGLTFPPTSLSPSSLLLPSVPCCPFSLPCTYSWLWHGLLTH